MDNTLYRKVYCKDRMPNKGGEYLTDLGDFIFIRNGGLAGWFTDPRGCWEITPLYWLEPIPESILDQIESAIKTTLVIQNKDSIHFTMAAIKELLNPKK